MARYFAELSYCGSRFNGWQVQPNAPSVQQEVERGVSTLTREAISVVGAGRTDTGVHARYYVIHFDYLGEKDVESADFLYHLNSLTSRDIVYYSIKRVDDQLHARFDAVSREYKYYISNFKNPFSQGLTAQIFGEFDLDLMNQGAKIIMEYRDFTSFAKLHTDVKTNLCEVTHSLWEQQGSELIYTIRANRFLRNMVRAITGTLLDVGRGKVSLEQLRTIIEAKERSRAGSSAPAEGLYLTDVVYEGFERTVLRDY